MTTFGHNFPPADYLPIPADIRPGPGWTEQMLEMADHIGPYRTMLLVERFGGERIYIPADPARGKVYPGKGSIRDVVGKQAAATLSRVYRREYVVIPTARYALARARREAVIASARSGSITIADAARLLRTSRPYFSYLVNQTEEATGTEAPPARTGRSNPGQMDFFGDDQP